MTASIVFLQNVFFSSKSVAHGDARQRKLLDKATQKELIKESEKRNAVPHFAGLSLTAMTGSDIQEGDSTEGGAYEVIFNGMTVVR